MKYELQYTTKHTEIFEAENIKDAGLIANEHVTRKNGTILSVIPTHLVTSDEEPSKPCRT